MLKRIAARHSYRGTYETTPVPREDLVKIMEAGHQPATVSRSMALPLSHCSR